MNRRGATPLFSSKNGSYEIVVLLLIFVGLVAPAALATDSSVPLYSPREALRLARKPVSRMVDDVTCERIAGMSYQDKHLVANAHAALFRADDRREPFLRVVTREDGVYVARFPARPGEVIYGRAYILDPKTGKEIYGDETRAVCQPGSVSIGTLSPILNAAEDATVDQDENH